MCISVEETIERMKLFSDGTMGKKPVIEKATHNEIGHFDKAYRDESIP